MRYFLILGFVVLKNCYAQDSAQYVRRYTSVWRSVNVGYKINYLKTKDFQSNFENNYTSTFGSQLTSLVIELSGPDNYLEDNYVAINYFIPTTFTSGDTNKWAITGFSFEMSLFKSLNLLYLLKEFDLPLSANWQIGSLYQNYNNSKSHNFFLNFGLRLNPRVLIFKRLTIGIVGDISWDLSKPDWKYKREVVSESFDFKKTSYGVQLNIGWRYSNMQSSWMRIYNDLYNED